MRPLYQMLQRWVVIRFGRFDNGRTTVRPYKSLPVELLHVGLLLHHGFNGDGRTTVRPYKSLHVGLLHVKSSLDVVWYLSYYYFCVVS